MRKMISLLSLLFAVMTVSAQTELYLKGNIVPGYSILLTNAGNDVWQSEITLDDSRVFLFTDKYVFFECPSTGYRSDNLHINGGTYTVTFSMPDKTFSFSAPTDEYRISAFGSSVCNGQGATDFKGYAWQYGELLGQRYDNGSSENPFYVSGVSIGGNTTQNLLDRYVDLTRNHSRYAIIGLSMGNEGLHEAGDKQQVFDRFSTNMQTLIEKIKNDEMIPVVMNNYTRGDYTSSDYYYIKQMNLLIHQWDVSSVNVLGAIDDGTGKWASGYEQDNAHPTTAGHDEFFHAMTPSLFDAIASGKPQPERITSAALTLCDGNTIRFRGEETVHPFTISVRVKGGNAGRLLSYKMTVGTREGHVDVNADGKVVYTNITNRKITTDQTLDDDAWHIVTLTHYFAQGRTLLYLDGQPAGEVRERINALADVTIGDEQTAVSRQLSELFFWRSALSEEEMLSLCAGNMLKSSLEIYVPMFSAMSLENKAMSLNAVEYVSSEATSIKSVRTSVEASSRCYDLNGRRVEHLRNGVYIRNGKLFVNK